MCVSQSHCMIIITLVRHKKARFDSKMHGSTQQCPVRHKNARLDTKMPSPACTSWHCHYQTSPPPLLWKIFFPILFQYFVLNNQERNEKWNYIDMNSKLVYSISLSKLKCNHSFLFVMAIMSAVKNKFYRYGRIFCQFLHFLLIAPLNSDTHIRRKGLAHCWLNNTLNTNFRNYSQ